MTTGLLMPHDLHCPARWYDPCECEADDFNEALRLAVASLPDEPEFEIAGGFEE